ncbi:hypothetical protein [Nocardiopsis sp. CNT312]|uniref:hypothetical protein n=1 Tax=Nocardiopsis sp. CNT312 TaxID=1137268 RepID=UPI0004B07856|nr:hypothetical protein [Nocardiopsis sp. CNT312]
MAEHTRTDAVRRALAVGACVLAALALLGALLGPVWWLAAPERAVGTALGEGRVFTGVTEDVFSAEAYYALMTGAAGLLTGHTAYMAQFSLARGRAQDLRLVVLLAGFAGSVAAALLTWRVGVALDAPLHEALAGARAGETVTVGLRLEATAFLVAWPFLFVLQYAMLELISLLRRDLPGATERIPARIPSTVSLHSADGGTVPGSAPGSGT